MKAKQKVPVRKLSITVPVDIKSLIRQRAENLDLTVSQYIRRLVTEETQGEPLNVVTTDTTES